MLQEYIPDIFGNAFTFVGLDVNFIRNQRTTFAYMRPISAYSYAGFRKKLFFFRARFLLAVSLLVSVASSNSIAL